MKSAKTVRKKAKPVRRTDKPNYIEKSLWPLIVPIAEIYEDAGNVRRHPDRSVDMIAASLRRFRQQKPIVVAADGRVLAGNGTVAAARKLGWEYIAAQRSETLSSSHVESAAYALADNRTQEFSFFDQQGLSELLDSLRQDGVPLEEIGWNEQEYSDLLKSLSEPAPPEDFNEFDESISTDFKCPSCGYEWSGSPG